MTQEETVLIELRDVMTNLERQISSLKEFIEFLEAKKVEDRKVENKCCKKQEVLKEDEELTLGERLVIESLKNKLIPDDIDRDRIIDSIITEFGSDKHLTILESVLGKHNDDELLGKFYSIINAVIPSLLEVDISKLRIQ